VRLAQPWRCAELLLDPVLVHSASHPATASITLAVTALANCLYR
jgi:hypothetical protein